MIRDLPEALIDVLVALREACRRTSRVTSAISHEDVRTDEIAQLALTKAVEQVGEICNRLIVKFLEFAAINEHLELKEAAATRHRLVHGYETVQFETLWDTATISVSEMLRKVEIILDEAGEDHA
ncbi:MAG: HepT-like ribonuclease domain-containing protein [Pararhizobium sp.]